MTRPRLACCRAFSYLGGSGRLHWVHANDCPLYRRQEVGRENHPAGANIAVRHWKAHQRGCMCDDCSYVDHWLDRDDADGFEVVT